MTEYIYERTVGRQHRKEEIVRCRDCKHMFDWAYDRMLCKMWADGGMDDDAKNVLYPTVKPDGFCAWGEMREADVQSTSKTRAIEGVLMYLIDSSNTVEFDAMTAIDKAVKDIMEIMGGDGDD